MMIPQRSFLDPPLRPAILASSLENTVLGLAEKKRAKKRVEVQILGQRMLLKCDDDARHIERLATYVTRKVDEVAAHGPVSSSKLAILAALNIADDYFRALEEARELKRDIAAKSRELLEELED